MPWIAYTIFEDNSTLGNPEMTRRVYGRGKTKEDALNDALYHLDDNGEIRRQKDNAPDASQLRFARE